MRCDATCGYNMHNNNNIMVVVCMTISSPNKHKNIYIIVDWFPWRTCSWQRAASSCYYVCVDFTGPRGGSKGSMYRCMCRARPICEEKNRSIFYFSAHHAAIVLKEADLTPKKLTETVKALLKNKKKRSALSEAISKLAVPDAADRVAKEILTIIK